MMFKHHSDDMSNYEGHIRFMCVQQPSIDL